MKPKLILHIGHGKTGSTSIQDFLAKKNSDLLELGYLYPVRHSPRNNHVVLRAGFMRTESFNVHDYQVYSGDIEWFKQDSLKFFESLVEDITNHKPHTVILSAEQMFRDFSKHSAVSLAEFLSFYFSSVIVVAYIKSPIADYLSRLAQRIRTGVDHLMPEHRPIKKVIKYYEEQFPGCVKLHAFAKDQLVGGDVINDFLSRYIPDYQNSITTRARDRSNVSLSWPLLLGLRELRMKVQPNGKKPTRKTRMLLARVAKKYQKQPALQPNFKPRLKPEIFNFLTKSASDFIWLRDNYDVNFSDVDYSCIEAPSTPSVNTSKIREIENIIETSAIEAIDIDNDWCNKTKIYYAVYMSLFTARMRWKRLLNLYFRKYLSLKHKLLSYVNG